MTEEAMLVAMAKRLEAAGEIEFVEWPTAESREICWHSKGWHGYWTRFQFDAEGAVIETAAGC